MDYFGINSADDLPKIKEVLAEQMVEPTVIKDTLVTEEKSQGNTEDNDKEEALAVTEEGELIANPENLGGEES